MMTDAARDTSSHPRVFEVAHVREYRRAAALIGPNGATGARI
jgi:hypothetical protein